MDQSTFNARLDLLTPKQKSVLKKILAGKTCGEIAQERKVHPTAISHLLTAICKQFGLSNAKGEFYSYRHDLIDLFIQYAPDRVAPHLRGNHKIDLESPEGVVPLDSKFYIERSPIEANCIAEILKPGALLRLKAPRQMGKTSLMNRISACVAGHGAQTVFWDIKRLGLQRLGNLELLLKDLCRQVTQKLSLENQLHKYWDSELLSNSQNCSTYFEEYILPQVETLLVLVIDDVDLVFQFDQVVPDLLTMFRSWHEASKRQEIWEKLCLVMAYSTEEYAQLDINQSPFNVGKSINLPEFTLSQFKELSQRHGLDWNLNRAIQKNQINSLENLYNLLGGHPFLVRQALYEIAQGSIEFDQFIQEAPTDAGIYSNHLRSHLSIFNKNLTLKSAMQKIVHSSEPQKLDPDVKFKLNRMGVVRFQGNGVVPRCELYRLYFSQVL